MTRSIEFRYYAVRNGADLCELYADESGAPKITMEAESGIKTKLSGSFLVPGEEVNWLTDEIRPVMILDGTEHRLGLFSPASVLDATTDSSRRIRIDAYDRGWTVRDHRTESVLFLAKDTNYLSAIRSVLVSCGITVISEVPNNAVLAEDRADWEVGTSSLDIVNALLREINYEDLWFDADGTAILEPKATPTAENLDRILEEDDVQSLILPGLQQSTDFYATPNVYLCVCSNPDKDEAMVAVAENTNPQSPLSIARRGRRITQLVQVNNIASQAELQLYANRLVSDSLLRSDVLQINTCLLPGFGVGDVIGLRYGDIFAVCKSKRWSMDLKVGGSMSHTLERVVMNLD